MREIMKKLSSRKLWVCIFGITAGLCTAFGIDESEYTQIAGVVTSAVSVITYITSEACVDMQSR